MAMLLIDRKCCLCGKEFATHEEYAYKVKSKSNHPLYFCSWKHLQEYRAEKENAKKKRKPCVKRKEKNERTVEILKAIIDEGLTNDEIIQKLGVTRRSVDSIRYRYKELIKASKENKAG